jgi:hypothetical protein
MIPPPLLESLRALQGEIRLDARHCYWKGKARVPGVTTVIKVMDAPALDAWKVRVQVEGTARAAFRNPPPPAALDHYLGEAWTEAERLSSEIDYIERLTAIAKEEFEHERLANEAADVGKQVHALIEHAVRTQLGESVEAPTVTDEALFIFAGWADWAKRVGLKPIMAEGRVFHAAANYCGTFDLLAEVDGRPAILDWKSSPKIYPERRMQSAAYRAALLNMGFHEPLDGYIVTLPRDGGEIEMGRLEDCGPDMLGAWQAFESCLSLYRWLRQLEKAERDARKEAAA